MASGIITVGRKQYASGLYWENSPTGRVSQAAKEAARQPGAEYDFFVTRLGNKQGRVPQFGLAPSAAGFRPGMPSLAGCLANQQPGSWIGAFHLKEGTALVVIRDDLIVPDGDIFFLDEAEARDRVYQEMAIGGFQRIYAPESWGVPGADTMPISLLLNDRTDVRLKSVVLSNQNKIVLAVGVLLLLGGLGYGWHVQKVEEQQEIERLRQLATAKRLREQARTAVPIPQKPIYPLPKRYWEFHPAPLDVIANCQKALGQIVVAVAGWRLTGLYCTETSMKIEWIRDGGFSSPPAGTVVNSTGTIASGSVAFKETNNRDQEDLWGEEDVTKRYLLQNWMGSLSPAPADPPPQPPKGFNGEWNPPPPPWVKRSFTVTVPVLPWTLSQFFEDMPGIIVNKLTMVGGLSSTSQAWTVEGVIYENRR